jgi:hypothetical protein
MYGASVGQSLDVRPNRNSAAPNEQPMSTPGAGDRQTEIYTYVTVAGLPLNGQTPILYNADRAWANVTLTLENAGPVAVGTRADLFPVLSGKGELLITDVPMTFTIAKGYSRLYIAATALNRVKVQIAPFAWIEEVNGSIGLVSSLLNSLVTLVRGRG